MPMNGNDSPTQIADNQAIHDILSKILTKWRKDPKSLFSQQSAKLVDSPHGTNKAHTDSIHSQDDQIIKETVILTPEDFLAESHVPTASPEKEIPETQYVTLEKGKVSEPQEPIRQTENNVPKTVVQAFDIPKSEGPSSKELTENRIPETVVFSTQGISDANMKPEQQESVPPSTVKDQRTKEKSEAVKDSSDHVPETIVFKNDKNKK